jgi:ribonuclease J
MTKKFRSPDSNPTSNSRPTGDSRPNPRHNQTNEGRPPRSFGGGNRSNFRPKLPKTSAMASDKPSYITRKVVDRDEGTFVKSVRPPKPDISALKQGNLAHSGINPMYNAGPLLKTNSPENYSGSEVVRIIPLGGVSEVGMNMTAIECGEDIIIIDTGMGFGGGEKFPGVDYVIPDTTYVEQNRHKIRGIIYTHGHLDHIGAAPYILPKLGTIPIFGMPLTLALLKNRLMDFELQDKVIAKVLDLHKNLRLGVFDIKFFRLNHSIPDVIGLEIDTPMGKIAYCTDWKFDSTPMDGHLSDYGKLSRMGDEGVRLLLTDSLGILKPGYQMSERDIGKSVMKIFAECEGRVIFTTFASSIVRAQHVINACVKYNRKLALAGRSMIANFSACIQLGYLSVPKDLIVDVKEIARLPDNQVTVLATGSQGEDMASVSRMARDEHPLIKLQGGDAIIFSSSPIPGNEDAIQDLISKLSRKGVAVYRNKEFDLHVSGHACQEDLKLLFALTRPDYLQPIHGDHYMLRRVGELGATLGIPFDHNLIGENGRITELRADKVVLTEEVITDNYLLVDGTSVGSVSEVVLEERRQMSKQGSVILVVLLNKQKKMVAGPEIISRGFVYVKNSGELYDEIKEIVKHKFNSLDLDPHSPTYFSDLRSKLKRIVSEQIFAKTEKDPMVIPVVVQI